MTLASGEYLLKAQRKVVVWPAPDADGDGPDVWETRTNDQGQQFDQTLKRDAQNRVIKEYLPPQGFANRPGYDHTDNFVQVDSRGNVVRQPNGEAICLKPGQAVVYNPDGSVEYLADEYAQFVFGKAHESATPVVEESATPVVEESEEDKSARLELERVAKVEDLKRQLAEVEAS